MNTRNIQLNGSNLCNTECLDKNAILHPETCVNQILTTDNSTSTLPDWIDGDDDGETHHGSFADYNNLKAWLDDNFNNSSYSLPTASNTVKGGIKVGNYLTINEASLSVDVTTLKPQLDIPTINTATLASAGTVALGNSTTLNNTFSDSTIPVQENTSYSYNGSVYNFPLRLDSNSRAGVAIPTGLFSTSSIDFKDWTLDWSKYKTNVVISDNLPAGVSTNYILLGNKSNNSVNGQLGYNNSDVISTNFGYPRFALVAGNNVTFTKYTDTFVTTNPWSDHITEILISATSNPYDNGEGILITNDTISINNATSLALGGIKIGYVENGELKPVLLDSNSKAYVNISNSSLKNHEVTAINQDVHDEHSNYFNTYTVRCNISNEDLTIVNINDFKQVGNGYNTIQSIDTDDTYEWAINSAGDNNNIAIIHAISTAAKGCFKLIIDHNNDGNHIIETHNVGFVIDTPPTYTFAWFSTCNWNISLYGDGNIGDNACRVYLKVPSDFTGTVKITDIHLVTVPEDPRYGNNIGSMSGTSYKKWTNGDPFSNGNVTNITGTQVTGDFKIPVDSFVTLSESPSVGDFLYDSEINDTLIHNLLTRVKAIEIWIQNQQ